MVKSKDKIFLIIIIILFFSQTLVFFDDNKIHRYTNHTIMQNSKMTDYHLGEVELFDEEDIKYLVNPGQYSDVNTFDLTNIAMRGSFFYYDYLRTNNTKYAQLILYYANFLLSDGNFYDYDEYILFPSHLGHLIFKMLTLRKNYEDAMGASFAAILFINVDELLTNLNITNNYYLECSTKIIKGITLSEKKGGGKIVLSKDEIWFIHHNKNNRVLNGHMFTIANLYRYMNYTSDFTVKDDIDKGITSLKNNLYLYLRDNKQLYDLKIYLQDIDYSEFYSPYYIVHPMLLYYLYENSNDTDLLDLYFIFMESSLIECNFILDANPYLSNDMLYLNYTMISNVDNILTSSKYPYELIPSPDYYFREPIANYNLLNSLNLTYSISINDEAKIWYENKNTNFTSDISCKINSSDSLEITIMLSTYGYTLNILCNVNNNQTSIKEKSLIQLDLSKKLPYKKMYNISIIYEALIIILTIVIIVIIKKLSK